MHRMDPKSRSSDQTSGCTVRKITRADSGAHRARLVLSYDLFLVYWRRWLPVNAGDVRPLFVRPLLGERFRGDARGYLASMSEFTTKALTPSAACASPSATRRSLSARFPSAFWPLSAQSGWKYVQGSAQRDRRQALTAKAALDQGIRSAVATYSLR